MGTFPPFIVTGTKGASRAPVMAGSTGSPAWVDIVTEAELTTHTADSTNVHGITDASTLVVTTDSRLTDARTPSGVIAGDMLGSTWPTLTLIDSAVGYNLASDMGLLAQAFDYDAVASNTVLAAGVIHLTRLKIAHTITSVTKLCIGVGVLAATPANSYAALYNATGTQLGVSVDISASLTTTGFKQLAMTGAGLASIAPGYIYGAILVGSAGTMCQLNRGSNAGVGLLNALLPAASSRHGLFGSGQTSMPSPLGGSMTAGGVAFWMGLA